MKKTLLVVLVVCLATPVHALDTPRLGFLESIQIQLLETWHAIIDPIHGKVVPIGAEMHGEIVPIGSEEQDS